MATFIFHSKYHKNAHHTVPTSGFPDSASDPIASEKYPFMGVFYNNLSVNLSSNSFNWGNTSTAVSANSAIWNRYNSVFTTVKNTSAFWQNNLSVYNTYKSLSANFNSTHTTVYTNSGYWNRLYIQQALYKNQAQENTRQKNFATIQIEASDISNIILDLSAGQVSYYVATSTSNISGFVGARMGGLYSFYVVTDGTCDPTVKINFNPNLFKFSSTNSFIITGTRLGKFEFIYDGIYLHGKGNIFDSVSEDDVNTYFSGSGILLEPNPYIFSNNEGAQIGNGLLIQGVYPYSAGTGVQIVYVPPCP